MQYYLGRGGLISFEFSEVSGVLDFKAELLFYFKFLLKFTFVLNQAIQGFLRPINCLERNLSKSASSPINLY